MTSLSAHRFTFVVINHVLEKIRYSLIRTWYGVRIRVSKTLEKIKNLTKNLSLDLITRSEIFEMSEVTLVKTKQSSLLKFHEKFLISKILIFYY